MTPNQDLRLVWLRLKPPLTILLLSVIFFIFCIEIYMLEPRILDAMKKELHYASLAYVSFWVAFLLLVNELNKAAGMHTQSNKYSKIEIRYN